MNELYIFASTSPILTFCIVWMFTEMVIKCCSIIFNRNNEPDED